MEHSAKASEGRQAVRPPGLPEQLRAVLLKVVPLPVVSLLVKLLQGSALEWP